MAVNPLSGGELENACRAYATKAAQNTQQWIANNCRQKLNMTSQLLEYDYNRHYSRCKETLGTTIGNNRIGIMQKLNVSVVSCKSLILTATVKADYQTLTGTGWQGREAPVAVFIVYKDASGVLHNLLSENPNDTSRRMFWQGFYYADPVSPSITAYGTKVPKGQWYTYTFDLMSLYPKPVDIDFVGAEGDGWATRDGKIKSISIHCVQ